LGEETLPAKLIFAGSVIFSKALMSLLQKGQSHREEAKRAKIFKKLKENLQCFSRKPSKS
jgi:hypothetical protein